MIQCSVLICSIRAPSSRSSLALSGSDSTPFESELCAARAPVGPGGSVVEFTDKISHGGGRRVDEFGVQRETRKPVPVVCHDASCAAHRRFLFSAGPFVVTIATTAAARAGASCSSASPIPTAPIAGPAPAPRRRFRVPARGRSDAVVAVAVAGS